MDKLGTLYDSSGRGYVKFRRVEKDNSPGAINEVKAEWDHETYAPVGVHKVLLSAGKVSEEVLDQYKGGKKSRKASRKSKKKSHKKRPTKKNNKKNNKKRTRKH